MSRLVAEHFNPRGMPKRAFATANEAGEYRKATPGIRSKKVYRCGVCGKIHLGRSDR